MPILVLLLANSASALYDSEAQSFLGLINSYRAQNNLASLSIDAALQDGANWMSNDMLTYCVTGKYTCSHTDSTGRTFDKRLQAFGYPAGISASAAENLAWGYGGGATSAQQAFDLWKNSPGHQANMLGSSYVAIGISRSCNAGDCAWVTDFGSKIVKPFNAGTTPTPTPVPTKTPAPTPIPTSTSGTLLINSNPSGAAVSIANTGKNLGVTPYSINPAAYPSPTFLRLSKSGYQSINFPIYNWMVPPRYTSLSYNLKPLSTSTPTPTPTPVPTKTPAPTPVPTSTSGALLINSNPSGATVTITNTGQNLGVTPVYINPKIYPSPTFLRLTKAGYQPKNIAIYNWMVPPAYISLSYTLQPQ